MELVPQYPDLTEIHSISFMGDIFKESNIETEFAFAVAAPGTSERPIQELGFEAVSCMNNWWPTHYGQQRKLTLYWKRYRGKPNIQGAVRRVRWCYDTDDNTPHARWYKWLACGGCGFAIGQPPLLKENIFAKFFTLMHMPLKVSPIRQNWLTKHNFRLLDTGTQSTYWINGWDPKTYSYTEELKIVGDWKDPDKTLPRDRY